MSEVQGNRQHNADSTPEENLSPGRLTRDQQAAVSRICALWQRKPRDLPRVERTVAQTMVEHRVPIEYVTAALGLTYVRVARMVKRATGKLPSALAVTEARAAEHITQPEMIALLSHREYDPPVSRHHGVTDVRHCPNSVSVLQQAYFRGLVTQGELWAIADTITVRKSSARKSLGRESARRESARRESTGRKARG